MRRLLTWWWMACALINGVIFGFTGHKLALLWVVFSFVMFGRSLWKLMDCETDTSIWVQHHHSVPDSIIKSNQRNNQ